LSRNTAKRDTVGEGKKEGVAERNPFMLEVKLAVRIASFPIQDERVKKRGQGGKGGMGRKGL